MNKSQEDAQIRKYIKQYLNEARMMQLATIGKNGKPWVCNVWFGFDNDLNIY